ncbi:MAG: GTPase Era [Sphaerochaetaceae bacterium]|jgi:GTP-binding protein Era
MKSATVTVIGRPSSGKSTLINTICEAKVSIVAPSPQTTRNAIKGVYTDQRGQLILIDTPGYHQAEHTLNLRLQETTKLALEESDVLLYLIDPTRPPQKEELLLVELIKKANTPVVVGINKCDIATDEDLKGVYEFLKEHLSSAPLFELSAQDDTGVDEVLIELFALAPEGELHYPESTYTDQPLEFRISEIIREKTITLLSEELPHAIFVEVADLEYSEAEDSIWIRAFINVERESQKGIVVGKGGSGIKKIRQASFKEIRRLFDQKSLHLDLRVKTVSRWRKKSTILDSIL